MNRAAPFWPSRRRAGGFTLIEAAITTVIIGVGFMAMLQLIATGTVSNIQGAQSTTGINLAKNVREMSLRMPYANLPSLHGQAYTPPIDSRGQPLADFDGWSQAVNVQAVDPNCLTLDIADSDPDAVRITVSVTRSGQEVCQVSWYALDDSP